MDLDIPPFRPKNMRVLSLQSMQLETCVWKPDASQNDKLVADFIHKLGVISGEDEDIALTFYRAFNHDPALAKAAFHAYKRKQATLRISSEEDKHFENALKSYGKDFFAIKNASLQRKTVPEIVEHYYTRKPQCHKLECDRLQDSVPTTAGNEDDLRLEIFNCEAALQLYMKQKSS